MGRITFLHFGARLRVGGFGVWRGGVGGGVEEGGGGNRLLWGPA